MEDYQWRMKARTVAFVNVVSFLYVLKINKKLSEKNEVIFLDF